MDEEIFSKEKSISREGYVPVGIDEAGRGPLAGPVVAAAVMLRDSKYKKSDANDAEENSKWNLVRDSKKLSPKQRERTFEFIQSHFYIGVGIIGPETIDRVNILQATFLAMRSAVSELRRIMNKELGIKGEERLMILVDGNQLIPNLSLKQEAIIDGDATVKSIAAASIVAKVTRDRIVVEADKLYPGYGLVRHKGYGTKEHMEALRRFGPSPIHRMSFDPVRLSIPENLNRKLMTLNRHHNRGLPKR